VSAYDVVVVGAGVVGVCTAWELARRDARVCLLDRGAIGDGTTGGASGHVLSGDGDAGPVLELARHGQPLFAELEDHLGPGVHIRRRGALVVHPDEATWLAEPARVQRLREAGVDARLLGPGEVRALEPQLTGAIHGAVHVAGDLQCDPQALTAGLAYELRRLGVDVREHAEVGEIVVEHAAAVGARVGDELVRGRAIVIAAGAWSGQLARSAGMPLPVEPRAGRLVRLRMPAADDSFLRHTVLDGAELAATAATDPERRASTVLETTWDGRLIVGATRERSGFGAPAADPELERSLLARAARLVPAIAELRPERSWVGFGPWTPDRRPVIGESSLVPRLWVATGHDGAGVALGPITGRLLAAAIAGDRPALDLAPFGPDRFL
jgi:D-hydroxyproline dehydrogenase subunit beta